MPLHVWLPRAHPIAPAPVSALMSGVMIKVALYGLVRVLVDWLGVLPSWFGVLVLALGALSAVGGVVYALFQHDLKRLLALHSIENVGIIVLGLGACLVLRARGRRHLGGVRARRRRCCTRSTTPSSRRCSSSAPARSSGRSARSSSTGSAACCGGCRGPGGAFLVGAMAIAGLPPLNGFASEWLTLQALLHVPAYGERRRRDGRGASRSPRSRRPRRWRVFCFVKVVGLVLLGPPRRRRRRRGGRGARRRCGRGRRRSRSRCVVLGARAGPPVRRARRARAVACGRAGARRARTCPAPARCRRAGSRSSSSG